MEFKKFIKENKEKINIVIIFIISICLTILTYSYIKLLNYVNVGEGIIKFILANVNITKCIIVFIIYFCALLLLYKKEKEIMDFLYKYRYAIAGIIFILCVVFEISGSSIGMWKYCVGNELHSTGDILGKARAIRGDEWVVFTPFAISQETKNPDNYQYFSNIIRGDTTDAFIVYGQPVKDISMIFRPFQIGYLIFGSSRGLSFYWCGRFIALFLVMFELGMLITDKKKGLALILALLSLLSPAVEWWYSVNGFVEMIVFGSLAILMLQKYMVSDNIWKRLFYLFVIGICGGGYILTFYPAWQIPMSYIFAGLAIWVIIKNKKECKINLKDILSIIFVTLIILVLLLNILIKSKDTISLVMNTSYPGARLETGGGYWRKYFSYPSNMFFTLDDSDLGTNVCEAAVFFDLFPIGFILAAIVLFKEKNKDPLLIITLIISIILGAWCILGFPKILAKLSLLYLSPAKRTFVTVGFLNILILVRSMSLIEKPLKIKYAFIISVICTILVTAICINNIPAYYGIGKILITVFVLMTLYMLSFTYNNYIGKKLFIFMLTIVLMFTSFLINPIRKGIDAITKQPVGQEIKKIQEEKPGLWIVEGAGYPLMNYPIMYGAPTINSTNTYPDLERWEMLDEEEKYKDIYNRYAHILIDITEDEETKFELVVQDSFKIYLPVNKLKDLNVKYIFTVRDLENFENDEIKFEKRYEDYGIRIYEIDY